VVRDDAQHPGRAAAVTVAVERRDLSVYDAAFGITGGEVA
jgi:hypothetical protein